jgi:probable F420-dependent oxidoreductase
MLVIMAGATEGTVAFDIALRATTPGDIADESRRLEAAGWGGAFTFDGPHDPFLPVVTAAAHTERLVLFTNVAVALARNPMTVAITANDLQLQTGGRFLLGIGSQVRQHIERRFSMPWSRPVDRMAEFATAVKAIQAAWSSGEPLSFAGEFYRHDLMPPFFDPGPNPHGPPPVLLGAVGPRMTEAAGRAADGLLGHPFTSASYFASATMAAFESGVAASGRTRDDVMVVASVLVATGATDEEYERNVAATRHRLAFYASTPAYRPVLEHHGWGDLQPLLQQMTRDGRWDDLAGQIDDEVLDTLAIRAPIEWVRAEVEDRFGAFRPERVTIAAPGPPSPETLDALASALCEGDPSTT